ncbi:MAG TPA: putative metal-dependent hydrolase [Rubricoccaceae bacterium]|jgi:hypothetical protein
MPSFTDDALRYPAGRFEVPIGPLDAPALAGAIAEIEAFPAALRGATADLPDAVLDTPYRLGGWTVRQVVHHVADSHANAVLRVKWALTETDPAILAYDEAAWAELPDARLPVEVSLRLVEALHTRWAAVLRPLAPADWARRFIHPVNGPTRLDRAVAMYAWHGRHHLAHIAIVTGAADSGSGAA